MRQVLADGLSGQARSRGDVALGAALPIQLAHPLVDTLPPRATLGAFLAYTRLCSGPRGRGNRHRHLPSSGSFLGLPLRPETLRRCARHQSMGRLPERAMVAGQEALQRIAQVLQEVPSVGDLNGVGCSLGRSFDIGVAPVAANNLDTRMGLEPRPKRLRLAVRQQVHGAMSLQIH